MFCTNCGFELRENDRFCAQCAKPTGLSPVSEVRRQLALPPEGKKIAGVCAGFARYFGADVTLMRIVWLVASLATGVGFIAYLIAWLLMPKETMSAPVPATQMIHQTS